VSKHVKKTSKVQKGVTPNNDVLSIEVASAQLYNSGKFETRADAEAALLEGGPIETYFNIYQLVK
jgi:hypothetical protein